MKKLFIAICMLAGTATMQAQNLEIADQLGVGLNLGLNGVGLDLSTRITPFVGVRVGMNYWPEIKIDTKLDMNSVASSLANNAVYKQFLSDVGIAAIPDKIKVQGKTSLTTWHVLFDVYPFTAASSFHITAGAYFGKDKIVKVYNKDAGSLKAASDFNSHVDANGNFTYISASTGIGGTVTGVEKLGVEMGNYFLEPTPSGDLDASIQVKGFRPYLGLGFGRAVPKNRVGVQFDLGAQFWGTPNVYVNGANGEHKLSEGDTKGKDGGALKIISKIAVFPVLNLRIVGRIL